MIERLNNAENLLAVILVMLGTAVLFVGSHVHDNVVTEAGAAIVGAGSMAFKGARGTAGG